MTRPSERSRRPGRSRPKAATLSLHADGLQVLRGDYPQAIKSRVYLACRGSLHGPRRCIVCGQPGVITRVSLPQAALRPVEPRYDEIQAYWLCPVHQDLNDADPEVAAALARRGTRR
jgi:hypothetical protein